MVVSKKKDISRCSLKVKDQIIKQVSAFNYLGSTITEDARCKKEDQEKDCPCQISILKDKQHP